MKKEELFSAVRGLNIKEYSIKDMEYLMELFKIKSRQMEREIIKRKANSPPKSGA